MRFTSLSPFKIALLAGVLSLGTILGSCAMVDVPSARTPDVPTPVSAKQRVKAVNEHPDSVMYLPLGDDVLVPEISQDDPLPYEMVGPFELRNETLAGALQLILAEYDIGLAFETNAAMERRITVTNLSGELSQVVRRVCSLANLYCSLEDGTLIVKETQTFTVTLPPIGAAAASSEGSSSSSDSDSSSSSSSGGAGGDTNDYLASVSTGLSAILSQSPIVDTANRTVVYTATQRTAALADRYFQRLRANTAMIVYETYIWEVQLTAGNSAGVDWSALDSIGKYTISGAVNGAVGGDFTNPISIGLPTTGNVTPTDFLNFLSQFGAVKTISQPQITVLSGASAQMRVADTQNYVSEISTTLSDTQSSTSVTTDTVDSGFTLTIGSAWDKATVYTSVNIEITDVLSIDDFSVTGSGEDSETTRIQLPQTTERELETQIRVRPGDSVLIGGLVRERDNFDKEGLGFMEPIVPQSRTAQSQNLELVIMLRPRVIVYTDPGDLRYTEYAQKKAGPLAAQISPVAPSADVAPSYTSSRPETSSYQEATPPSTPLPLAPSALDAPVQPVEMQPLSPPAFSQPASPAPAAYKPSAIGSRASTYSPSESSSVEVSPLTAPSPYVPSPARGSAITPSVTAPEARNSDYVSPYETYDYYSPKR